jgi:hypothetical protein
MKDKEFGAYQKKTLIVYSVICAAVVLLSCLGLIWGDWEIILCAACGGVFGVLNLFLLFKSSAFISPDKNASSTGSFAVIAVFRALLMIAGIGVPALIIFLTKTDASNQYRYLNILMAAFQFTLGTVITAIVRPSQFNVRSPVSEIKPEETQPSSSDGEKK